MDFKFHVAMDVRAYGIVSAQGPTMDEALASLTPEHITRGFSPNGRGSDDFDFLNATSISVTGCDEDDDGEMVEELDLTFDMTLANDGRLELHTHQVRELITAIENDVAYNSDVYAMLLKQLADVDDKTTA